MNSQQRSLNVSCYRLKTISHKPDLFPSFAEMIEYEYKYERTQRYLKYIHGRTLHNNRATKVTEEQEKAYCVHFRPIPYRSRMIFSNVWWRCIGWEEKQKKKKLCSVGLKLSQSWLDGNVFSCSLVVVFFTLMLFLCSSLSFCIITNCIVYNIVDFGFFVADF